MKIYHGQEKLPEIPNPVVTSGTFDGVHLGHRKILYRLREIAAEIGGETVVITFWPHPRHVLNPDDHSLKLLSTFDEKTRLFAEIGIDHLIRIPFTKEFSKLSSEEFIKNILVEKIHTKKLVIGYDHRFGRNREGSFEHLKAHGPEYGFDVEEIPRQDVDHNAVSSTKIREALSAGDVNTAGNYLGRPYSIAGTVVEGDQIGRDLGYPTANLYLSESYKLIPADGIYAVRVEIEQEIYNGMMSIGFRPTLNGTSRTLEVNIFDFDSNIYGKSIRIFFIEKIREEVKFDGLEALKSQMTRDKRDALSILKS